MVSILKKKTAEKANFKIKNLGDCIRLSNLILEINDEFISYNTLRRFYGIVKSPKKTSTKTLDILSRFNDYSDYGHFLKSFKFENKWKQQNDLYEVMSNENDEGILQLAQKSLKHKENHIGITIQILRELIITKKYNLLIQVFELEELNFNKLSYDEITHIGNGVGLLLRNFKLDISVLKELIKIKNYQDLVLTMFVDYSHLNGYYLNQINVLNILDCKPHMIAFKKCLFNLHLYLNNKKVIPINIQQEDTFHPILKSRIVAQHLFYHKKNKMRHFEDYVQHESAAHFPIEYFYEIILTCLVTKDIEVMRWTISQVEKNNSEKHIFHIRHLQHYYVMKSLYYAAIGDKKLYRKAKSLFSLEAASTSYKEFLRIFVLMGQYHFSQGYDRKFYKTEYIKLAKKLGYPLFDENYLQLV